MKGLITKTALLSIVFSPMLMRADVVFSNVTGLGDPSNSREVCGSGISGCGGNSLAEAFIPSANYTMTDAKVDVRKIGDISTFDVFLDADSGGAPGSEIEQIGFGLTATDSTVAGSLITADTIGTPITLTAGTSYWLVLKPHAADSKLVWAGGGSPLAPRNISLDDGNTWSFPSSGDSLEFQIDGTLTSPVPEPATFGMIAGIATFLYGIKRVRAKA